MGPTSRKAAGWLCIIAASSGACAQVLGIEDWTDPSAAAGSSGGAGNGSVGGAGAAGNVGGAGGAVDCTGRCVEAAPETWLGPAAFKVQGPVTDKVPECPAPWQTIHDGGASPFYMPAICNACTCNLTSGICTGQLDLSANAICNNPDLPYLTTSDCSPLSPPIDLDDYLSAKSMLTDSPICSPSGGGVGRLPPPEWTVPAVLCGSSGGACDGAQVCLPPTPPDFLLCIYKEGDHDCPPSYTKNSFSSAFDDSRGCSSCGCETGAGQCQGLLSFYSTTDCSGGAMLMVNHPTACSMFNLSADARSFRIEPNAQDGCPATGGTPTGTVTATAPITVCCPGS